jgi:hypothetical protein
MPAFDWDSSTCAPESAFTLAFRFLARRRRLDMGQVLNLLIEGWRGGEDERRGGEPADAERRGGGELGGVGVE